MNLKNVKDRLKDKTLDLSLCDLKEVPVREIATIRKATHLDLSNNLLTTLPGTFVSLKHLVKLNLSQNMLTEIPENFGELRQLKHLDLYANQISRLPLSLSELKNLRWLDLKENPLTPAVASVAGNCSNLAECQDCARNIVTYLTRVKLSIEEEKLKRLNTIIVHTEADTMPSKKIGKKKKKKQTDKNKKQDLDKNVFNPSGEQLPIDKTEINTSKLVDNEEYSSKQCGCKGNISQHTIFKPLPYCTGHSENACRYYASMIVWLFLLYLGSSLAIVILPLYSKQSEWFINYLETNIGVPLKAFQKHNTDMLYSVTRIVVNIYDNIYYA